MALHARDWEIAVTITPIKMAVQRTHVRCDAIYNHVLNLMTSCQVKKSKCLSECLYQIRNTQYEIRNTKYEIIWPLVNLLLRILGVLIGAGLCDGFIRTRSAISW